MLGITEKAPPRPGSFLQRSTEIFSHVLVLFCHVKGSNTHKRDVNHSCCLEKRREHRAPFKELLANSSPKNKGRMPGNQRMAHSGDMEQQWMAPYGPQDTSFLVLLLKVTANHHRCLSSSRVTHNAQRARQRNEFQSSVLIQGLFPHIVLALQKPFPLCSPSPAPGPSAPTGSQRGEKMF